MKLLITTQAIDTQDPILGFFHRWVEEFAAHADHVYVICLRAGEYSLPSNVTIYSLGKESGENRIKYTVRFYRYFLKIFFRERVDFVFFHMGAIYNIMAMPFFLVRSLYKTKFYWWKTHGHINWVGRCALRCIDRVFTASEVSFPLNTSKKSIIGHAIDTDLFSPTHTERDVFKVIYVGRIGPIKHLEDFVRVAQYIHVQFPSARFDIIGPVTDVAYCAHIRALIENLALHDVVSILEPRKNTKLPDVYSGASLFLNTSQTHSMDKTILESMLCGCIPITHNKAFKEMLQPYNLFDTEGTPESYARIITDLMRNQHLDTLRVTLRERVKKDHSVTTLYNRIFT